MMKRLLLSLLLLPALLGIGYAETVTFSWEKVTTYADDVPIASEDLPNLIYILYIKEQSESAYKILAVVPNGENTVTARLPYGKKKIVSAYVTATLDELESGGSNVVEYTIPKIKTMPPQTLTVERTQP